MPLEFKGTQVTQFPKLSTVRSWPNWKLIIRGSFLRPSFLSCNEMMYPDERASEVSVKGFITTFHKHFQIQNTEIF